MPTMISGVMQITLAAAMVLTASALTGRHISRLLTEALSIADRFSISTLIEPIRLELHLSDSGIAFLTGVALDRERMDRTAFA